MMRPPEQVPKVLTGSAAAGKQIFLGKAAGLSGNMCATCHVESLKLYTPQALIEWPTNPVNEAAPPINPDDPSTWPISDTDCPNGKPGPNTMCPVESAYGAAPKLLQNGLTRAQAMSGALVTPLASSQQLAVIRRFNEKMRSLPGATAFTEQNMTNELKRLRAPLAPNTVVGRDYVIPLSPPSSQVTSLQRPRLPANADGSVTVPLFSDLKRHNMGSCLSDPVSFKGAQLPSQGTDVAQIVTSPQEYMTRPLWGVADTGPWLHDARALTLHDAIVLHGDTASGCQSEAAPIIDAFEKLTPQQQQSVVDFLLTLQLPEPGP
jgi:hypothetical protein